MATLPRVVYRVYGLDAGEMAIDATALARVRPIASPCMRVRVDGDACQGHNRCYSLAPELFDVDDYGHAVVIGDGLVTPELEEKARLAVANCPEYAITVDTD